MDSFSIQDCSILWFKNAKIKANQKQAMKAELKTMSEIIADAMKFIEEKRMDAREIYFKVLFNSMYIEDYMLEIFAEGDDWEVDITNLDHQLVGNIVSEKWSLVPCGNETDYELPETV